MEKQENRSHPPCRWGYRGAMAVIRPMLRWVFHMRVENQATQGFEGPAVLEMNHQGLLDFLLAAAAFPQREISYVGSQRYFQNPRLARLLRWLGVIPKLQFYPDAGAIKNIMRRIKEGGLVGIFPAGQTSMSGVPGAVPHAKSAGAVRSHQRLVPIPQPPQRHPVQPGGLCGAHQRGADPGSDGGHDR